MDDPEIPVELSDDIDITKAEIPLDEILEVEVVDVVELLADEPKDPMELADEDDEYKELELLMDPYGINDY